MTTLAGWVADTTDLSSVMDDGSYARVTFSYKTVAARGRVTRRLQAEGAAVTDILSEEISARANDFRDIEETGYLVGSSASSNQFDSVRYLIPDSQAVAVGGTLTLKNLDKGIDKAKGMPSALVMSKACRREVNALLQANQRYVETMAVKGAFTLPVYSGIPIYVSTVIADTQTFDGMTTADGSGSYSSIYILKWSEVYVAELTPVTIKMLATTSSQYDTFDIYCDQTLVMRDYTQTAKVIDIAV